MRSIAKLEEAGYLEVDRSQGTWSSYKLVTPCHQSDWCQDVTSDTMSPELVTPCHSTGDTMSPEPPQNHPGTTQKVVRRTSYPDDFEAFWKAYDAPSGRKDSKKKAFDVWKRKKRNGEIPEIDELLDVLDRQKKMSNWKRGFMKAAHRWLDHNMWDVVPSDSEIEEERQQSLFDDDEEPMSLDDIAAANL